jgi:hypothetical protein
VVLPVREVLWEREVPKDFTVLKAIPVPKVPADLKGNPVPEAKEVPKEW